MARYKRDPCLLHRGIACHPGKGEEKCLTISKGEGRHVDKFVQGLHFVKQNVCKFKPIIS